MDTSNKSFQHVFVTRKLCTLMWLITHIFLYVWQRIFTICKYLHLTDYLPLPHCPLIYKPTEIFLGDRCMPLLVFFCIGSGRLHTKLRSCFFGCLASLSVCPGMMFSLIEYLIAYSLVWILSRVLWKSKRKQADKFHLSHVCWHAQGVLIDWSGFANALPESLLYLQLSDILSFQSCFHRR